MKTSENNTVSCKACGTMISIPLYIIGCTLIIYSAVNLNSSDWEKTHANYKVQIPCKPEQKIFKDTFCFIAYKNDLVICNTTSYKPLYPNRVYPMYYIGNFHNCTLRRHDTNKNIEGNLVLGCILVVAGVFVMICACLR